MSEVTDTPLRVIVVEDSEDDAALVIRDLRRGGFDPIYERVETVEALNRALTEQSWDLILSDYSMPHFSGIEALRVVREMAIDVPFIFVSGTIDEDTAVNAMKAGAHDYMMKGNKKRLIPAVRRELAEAEIRRQREQGQKDLRRRDERIRALHQINTAITSTLDLSSVLELLFEKVDLLLPYSAVTVTLSDKMDHLLEPVTSRHLDPTEWRGQQEDHSPSTIVFETQAPLVIRNLDTDPCVRRPEFYRKQSLVSYAGFPLIAKKQKLGTLSFYTRAEHEFTKDEIQFLETLAGQVAVAIHNSRLYDETKYQAAELEKANEVKSQFLSLISHELRTPLNVMMGYVELVQEGMLGEIGRQQSEALAKSLNHSRHLLHMITDILQATRIKEQKVVISRMSVTRIIDDLRASYEASLQTNLVLDWDISHECPLLVSDADKITQILRNLIDNAIKFTKKGAVVISVRELRETNQLEFRVSDTGIGIPEDKIPAIFEMFYQIDSSSTRHYEGLGLGLYLAKKNAVLLGGNLEVKSELGKGSTFIVTLPIAASGGGEPNS